MAIVPKQTINQKQDQMLMQTFAGARQKLAAGKTEAMRQTGQNLDRLQARVGGTVGGGLERERIRQTNALNQDFAAQEAELGGQEAQAKLGLSQAQQQAQMQQKQFDQTLGFQKKSFADQMKFQLQEFDENKKTNAINAMIALKDAGAKNSSSWTSLFEGMKAMGYKVPKNFGMSAPVRETTPYNQTGNYIDNYWAKQRNQ